MMTVDIPTAAQVIHITSDPSDIGKDLDVAVAVVSDAKDALTAMLAAITGEIADEARTPRAQWLAGLGKVRDDWERSWKDELSSDATPINPYRVVGELRAMDNGDSVVTHDSGNPRDQLLPFYRSRLPRGYLGWGKSHALGSSLGLIIGAKIAMPERFCLAVMGYAAFGMVGLNLETAVRNEIPITLVVLNNGTMTTETEHMRDSHELFQTRNIGGSYGPIAEALGARSLHVADPREISFALGQARRLNQEGHVVLIEMLTSASQTEFSCHRSSRGVLSAQ
jgi:acetolactate synthase-1/2/3 large subunit